MPKIDYVDVRVHVDGQPLHEYPHPAGDTDGTRSKTRFIESIVGKRFSVVVRLLENFELKFAPWYYAEVNIDDNDDTSHRSLCQRKDLVHYKGHLKRVHIFKSISDVETWDDADGKWVLSGFEFGPLGTTDEIYRPLKTSDELASKIGSIRVRFFRADRKRTEKAVVWDGEIAKPPDELPERALKGVDVKMNTKYVPLYDLPSTSASQPYHFEFSPREGATGEPHEFTFLYRTRKALESLGCINPSPTPAFDPDAQRIIDRQRYLIENLQAELEKTHLGRAHPKIKTEPGVKQENEIFNTGLAGLRKQDGTEIDAEYEFVEVAPPLKRAPMVIDLTDD